MINLTTSLTKKEILNLKAGDRVRLTGTIFSARDRAHQYLLTKNLSEISGSIIYHLGPIIKNTQVIAAGPTTSGRMNIYTPALIKKYGIKAIIGKGGMDDAVLKALKGKAVYFSAVGGAAVIYAKSTQVKKVFGLKKFGMPEAIWELEVTDFPLIVSMDAHGNSLHQRVYEKSEKILANLIRKK